MLGSSGMQSIVLHVYNDCMQISNHEKYLVVSYFALMIMEIDTKLIHRQQPLVLLD